MHTSEYPSGVVVNMTLKQIELDTRRRELKEAQIAHAQMGKPAFRKYRTSGVNWWAIFFAAAAGAFVVYKILTVAIDTIFGAFGQ